MKSAKIFRFISNQYRRLFAHRFFYKWNRCLYNLSLKGLGMGWYTDFSGEEAVLKKYISKKEKPLIFDVGANVGNWSKMALEINPTAQIYAFEPSLITFQKLQSRPEIRSFRVACGEKAGKAILYDRNDQPNRVHASLDYNVLRRIDENPIQEEVEVITLDSIIEKENISLIDFLKIDVEGFEFEVLLGAKNAISSGKIRTIQFEFNVMNVTRRRFLRDFYDLLPNFEFYRLLSSSQIPLRNYDPLLHEIFDYQNILAVAR